MGIWKLFRREHGVLQEGLTSLVPTDMASEYRVIRRSIILVAADIT